MNTNTEAYLAALAQAMELPVERFETPGSSVCPTDDRRGQRLISHYRIGEHSVVWCDPDVAHLVAVHHGNPAPLRFEDFAAWMDEHHAEYLGRGYEHLLPDGWVPPARPKAVQTLDRDDAGTVQLAAELLAACSEEDRDGADFELDALDPHLAGWVEDGRLLALCGGREWDPRPDHFDLGVIVHPQARRNGRGAAVVAAVSSAIVDTGGRPLYRCEIGNEGSGRLCRSVGYRLVVEVDSFRLRDEG